MAHDALMANAIARISDALGYDAAESMLASGCSLASVYAFAAAAAEAAPIGNDDSPESFRATMIAETVAPKARKVA